MVKIMHWMSGWLAGWVCWSTVYVWGRAECLLRWCGLNSYSSLSCFLFLITYRFFSILLSFTWSCDCYLILYTTTIGKKKGSVWITNHSWWNLESFSSKRLKEIFLHPQWSPTQQGEQTQRSLIQLSPTPPFQDSFLSGGAFRGALLAVC